MSINYPGTPARADMVYRINADLDTLLYLYLLIYLTEYVVIVMHRLAATAAVTASRYRALRPLHWYNYCYFDAIAYFTPGYS